MKLDLDSATRQAIEFDALLERIARCARTAGGATRIRGLEPSAERSEVAERLARVEECRLHLASEGRLVPGGLPDVRRELDQVAVVGSRLDGPSLRAVGLGMRAFSDLGATLSRADAERYPLLRAWGQSLPDFGLLAAEILRAIEPDGRLADDASSELARIRRARVRAGERLRDRLERMLRGPRAETTFRDDFVTERNGRFVVPVRTDAPQPVEGIVHASSSSGATVFVEPMAAVELNNERVRLAEEEREEVERLLDGWSSELRERIEELQAGFDGLGRVDAVQARAVWAEEREAVAPEVGRGTRLELSRARHPLLDEQLAAAGERIVPLDLELDPSDRVLVISGPNTGGKTVALKTIGLAVCMGQAGIPIPARAVTLPIYGQLRADIGDHQSIAANLSTFSAHVGAVARILEGLTVPALVLFDEIGSGTEPAEGEALGRAILEALTRPGVTCVATTHLGALKQWSATADQAVAAAMEFDPERLRPTYRLLVGSVGLSAGIDIAERLGLSSAVIRQARDLLDSTGREAHAYLKELQRLRDENRHQQEQLAEERAALEQQREQDRRKLEQAVHDQASRTTREIEELRKQMRASIAREVRGIRDVRERQRAERRAEQGRQRLEAMARQQTPQQDRPQPAQAGASLDAETVASGTPIVVRSLGRHGRVLDDRGKQLEVDLGGMRLTVQRKDVALPQQGASTATDDASAGSAKRRSVASRSGPAASDWIPDESPREVLLLGMRVDEAEERLDRFLDQAVLSGHDEVRIVHGHGTGRLRDAVRAHLDGHHAVARWRKGRDNEGGNGATVAALRG